MQPIWNRAQFKQTGKDTFLSNYWPFVGVCVLLALLSGDLFNLQLQQTSRELVSNSILIYDDPSLGNAVAYGAQLLSPYLAPFVAGSLLLSLLVVFPLQVGASRFFLESRPGYKAPFQRIGHGFVENYGNVFLTGLFKWLSPCSGRCSSSFPASSEALVTSPCRISWQKTRIWSTAGPCS